jgi:HAD superfamily hydrolase (TIGR01509 family)
MSTIASNQCRFWVSNMSLSDGSTMNVNPALILPRAILFDMDGTLTRPVLDFDQIRKDIGIGPGPILESIKAMSPVERKIAERILHGHEDRAAEASELNPGCREVLKWLADAKVSTALVTRNTRKSVDTVFRRHGLHFDVCITREDGKYKPDPAPLLLACQRLGVSSADAWMIGDGYHDIEAGVAARMATVWISHSQTRSFSAEPSLVVEDLVQLLSLFESIA